MGQVLQAASRSWVPVARPMSLSLSAVRWRYWL